MLCPHGFEGSPTRWRLLPWPAACKPERCDEAGKRLGGPTGRTDQVFHNQALRQIGWSGRGGAMISEIQTTAVETPDGRELCVELAGPASGRVILVHNGSPN